MGYTGYQVAYAAIGMYGIFNLKQCESLNICSVHTPGKVTPLFKEGRHLTIITNLINLWPSIKRE